MNEREAFEKAKKIILHFHPNAGDFYIHDSVLENNNWDIEMGYLDNGFHWMSVIFIPEIGNCLLKSSQSLELSEHPNFEYVTEREWRTWATGRKRKE